MGKWSQLPSRKRSEWYSQHSVGKRYCESVVRQSSNLRGESSSQLKLIFVLLSFQETELLLFYISNSTLFVLACCNVSLHFSFPVKNARRSFLIISNLEADWSLDAVSPRAPMGSEEVSKASDGKMNSSQFQGTKFNQLWYH